MTVPDPEAQKWVHVLKYLPAVVRELTVGLTFLNSSTIGSDVPCLYRL
jgi:hypothetical protein